MPETPQNRLVVRLLRIYIYYRCCLSLLLLSLLLGNFATEVLGASDRTLFLNVAASYTGLAFLTLVVLWLRNFQAGVATLFFIFLTDMVAQTLLMNASGGLESGLGFLMLVTVAAGSILFTGQMAILLAAMASNCIILESIFSVWLFGRNASDIFPAGLLGILLFLTALLFMALNRGLSAAHALAEQKSEQSAHLQQLNEMIVRRMLTGIIVVDAWDRIELVNKAAVQLLGGHRPGAPLAPGQSLRTVPTLDSQLQRWRTYPWLRTPPFQPPSSDSEVQANFTDLHQGEEKRTLIFLEDTRTLAQHAQRLKLASLGQLTGSIAHEIRNPLGAISHASQLLSEQAQAAPELARLTDIINRHSLRVNQIVDNVLQLSRQKAPSFQKLQLLAWLKRFLNDYNDGNPADHNIELEAVQTANPAVDIQVIFDPSHLQQIITNLLDNGLRYSLQETGRRWARLAPHVDPVTELPVLDVYDHGPGIAPQDRQRLFEPFFTTSREGSGLGLYIARELCEINYATLHYMAGEKDQAGKDSPGFFRVGFAHPERLLPRLNDAK